MPEGHSVHRIARQFARHFLGVPVRVSSPQGRFAAGAARLDGHTIVAAHAVGKQLFLEFQHGLWLRVHLGMYGAWDFAGEIDAPESAQVDPGARVVGATAPASLPASSHEDSPWSIGAPRRARLRMAESEHLGDEIETFPPEPVGQVRVRLLTERTVADLRGPTACEVQTPEEVRATVAKLGPDPLGGQFQGLDVAQGEERFTSVVRRKPTPIALLLMDQSVVSGIGNVYRAELLFRARLDPFRPGREVPEQAVRGLWRDWAHLLTTGVETGLMLTMDDLEGEALERAIAHRDDRHWVYHRAGKPCRVCGTPIAMTQLGARKLYWCPKDQK